MSKNHRILFSIQLTATFVAEAVHSAQSSPSRRGHVARAILHLFVIHLLRGFSLMIVTQELFQSLCKSCLPLVMQLLPIASGVAQR